MSKPKSSRKTAARKSESQPGPVPLPSYRSMERSLSGLAGGRRSTSSRLHEAQERIYDAWESKDPRERIALAKEALALSPDCADAYGLLAEDLDQSVEELIEFYRLAVAAGGRALGKEVFEEEVGYFWGLLETRPYMRARCSLAQALWRSGTREEAVDHYWDLLRLNPNDNQGARDLLMPSLIVLGRDSDAEKLYKQFEEDDMAVWRYSRALLNYRRDGDVPRAVSALKKAIQYNRHVPAFLLGHRKIPRELPDYVGFGDANEAIAYAHGNREAWAVTNGALRWLDVNRK